MRWKGRRRSRNVEDRRGGVRRLGGRGGLGVGVVVVAVLAVYLLGGDPGQLLQLLEDGGLGSASAPAEAGEGIDDETREFVAVTLGDTEDVWRDIFAELGRTYEEPRLVLFDGAVDTACGYQSAATGPFYCPGDRQVYLDASFFRDLSTRFDAPGDFAQAYVIAHEVGHHVQNLLGTSEQVSRRQSVAGEAEANDLSVRLELQADFFAGVFAHHAARTFESLEDGDLEEALGAAQAIGDDRLQMQARGYVVPESFTHGTSEQRVRWFERGFDTGDVTQGDTFSARDP